MPSFQSSGDFIGAIKEVDCLLEIARNRESSHPAHSALLKSSILLLMTKVESFLENIIEECRYFLEQCNLSAQILPVDMVTAVLQTAIHDSYISKLKNGKAAALEDLRCLMPFLKGSHVESLPIEVKFSYGKHGESEIRRIFKRIGVSDVFSSLDNIVNEEGGFSLAIKADINSLTAIRNNIIHSDASPNFTVEQVDGFVRRFEKFSTAVALLLAHHCDDLRGKDALLYEGL